MAEGTNAASRQIRSTVDSILLHDMKNLGFRLSLLLSNLEEHYGDPDFKRSVVELLHGTFEQARTTLGTSGRRARTRSSSRSRST